MLISILSLFTGVLLIYLPLLELKKDDCDPFGISIFVFWGIVTIDCTNKSKLEKWEIIEEVLNIIDKRFWGG